MAGEFLTLDDFDLHGRTALVRLDINSPLDPATNRILNDSRLREHLATLRDLRETRVAILAHQSRPGRDDCTTMEGHAERLSYLLGKEVHYIDSLFGRSARNAIRTMEPGDVVLLENTRFYAEEEMFKDDPVRMAKTLMVRTLAPMADLFVHDAFAAAHRAQPSLVGFCEVMPSAAGRTMEKEVKMLDRALRSPERPKVVILGGIKTLDSIAVTRHFLGKGIIDKVLTTGGVGNVFLWAQGKSLGKVNEEFLRRELGDADALVEEARKLLREFPSRILIPVDVAVNAKGKRREVDVTDLPTDLPIQDIGLDTVGRYIGEVRAARTIILNGPAGVFEVEEFSTGTRELFRAVAEASAFKVVGGGHTVAAVEQFGLAPRMDHVSTGGGALIDYLAGRPMPGVEALRRARQKFPGFRG